MFSIDHIHLFPHAHPDLAEIECSFMFICHILNISLYCALKCFVAPSDTVLDICNTILEMQYIKIELCTYMVQILKGCGRIRVA